MDKKVYEFISQQTGDPIVEWKTCAVSGKPFAIFQSDVNFYEKISPTFDGKKFAIPTPTLCPEERERRRYARRNEWHLYRRKCDKTGKSMMAMYPDDCGYTVYDWKIRYSDEWDAMEYGRDYDFNKTFFENFEGLNRAVPKKSLHIVDSMENCEYCNYGVVSKSCYLVMGSAWSENCLYGTIPVKSMYVVDGGFNTMCQNCYQTIHCIGCFECKYSDHSNNCKFSAFLSFCNNCDYCLGCVNLQTAKYCILNIQYSKDEYEAAKKEIIKDRNSILNFKKKFETLVFMSPKKSLNNVGSEGTFSNYVQNGKNNILCSVVLEGEDNKYSSFTGYTNQGAVYDGYATTQSAYTLETTGFTGQKSAFIVTGEYGTNDCYYCQHMNDSSNCFGCIGLKHKKYCILNKQYTKEEYEKIVAQIIAQMQRDKERGEFFPIQLSTFGYNETMAQTYYPMMKNEAIDKQYKWQDQEHFVNIPANMEKIFGKDLPTTIQEVGDDILDKIILCEETNKPFRIIKQELDFYRKYNIPLPTRHQDVRYAELFKKMMPNTFYIIKCNNCNKEVLSVYSPESGYNVWCEECYHKQFYG